MDCPHLRGKHVNYCGAYTKLMVPSIDELDNYCTIGSYYGCSVFQDYCFSSYTTQSKKREKKVAQIVEG